LNLFSSPSNVYPQIVAKQTTKQRIPRVANSCLQATGNITPHKAAPQFGCLGPSALREMDEIILRNPASPALTNIDLDAHFRKPIEAIVTKTMTLLRTPEYDVHTIKLKTPFAKGIRPGQHIYVAPKDLSFENPDQGYRRYSLAGVNRSEEEVKLVYREIKNGIVSKNVMSKARPGDRINIQGPHWNGFVLPPRSADMLAFAAGIANIAPMHCLLKTRLKLQEGPIGETHLFSTYHSPQHEVPLGKEKLGRLVSETNGEFKHSTTYSVDDKRTPEQVDQELRHILKLSDKQSVDHALQKILKLDAPLPQGEKVRVLRAVNHIGKDSGERKKALDILFRPNAYVYICGILDVEQTIRHAFKVIGHEAGRLNDTHALIDKMQEPNVNRWRFEGVRMVDRETKPKESKL